MDIERNIGLALGLVLIIGLLVGTAYGTYVSDEITPGSDVVDDQRRTIAQLQTENTHLRDDLDDDGHPLYQGTCKWEYYPSNTSTTGYGIKVHNLTVAPDTTKCQLLQSKCEAGTNYTGQWFDQCTWKEAQNTCECYGAKETGTPQTSFMNN